MADHITGARELPFDDQVRRALHEAARPGDPTGVAEEIRRRLGDPPPDGPGPDGGGAPGAAAPSGWPPARLLPWVAGAASVALLAGAGLGLAGAFGRDLPPDRPAEVASGRGGLTTVPSFACPGRGQVGSLTAGDRVLVLGSHEGWAAIRDPRATEQVVWVDAAALDVDPGQVDLAALPLEGCPELLAVGPTQEPTRPAPTDDPGPDPEATEEPDDRGDPDPEPTTPEPEPEPEPEPTQPDPEPEPTDTSPPTLSQLGTTAQTGAWVYTAGCGGEGYDHATVHATASDDTGVTGVRVAAPGQSSIAMTRQSGQWRAVVGPFGSAGTRTLTLTARDAAGNTGTATVELTIHSCPF